MSSCTTARPLTCFELMANNGLFTAFHEYLRTQGSSGLLLNKRGEEVVGVGIRNKISRKRKGVM